MSEKDIIFQEILKELLATNQKIKDQLDTFTQNQDMALSEIIMQNPERSVLLQQMAEYLNNPQTIADYVTKDYTKQNEKTMAQLARQFKKACLLFNPELVGMKRLNTKIVSSPSAPVCINQNTTMSNPVYTVTTTDLINYAENAYLQVYNAAYYRVGYLPSLTSTFAAIDDSSAAFPVTEVMGTDQTLNIASDSAQDIGTPTLGTGIRQVVLEGLDNSGKRYSETVTLKGTAAATTTGTFRQVDALYAIATGTDNSANGNIKVYKEPSPTPIYAVILASGNAWRSGRFLADTSGVGYIDAWTFGAYTTSTVRAQLRTSEQTGNYSSYITRAALISANNSTQLLFPIPIRIPQNMAAMVRAKTNSSTAEVTTCFELHFITG